MERRKKRLLRLAAAVFLGLLACTAVSLQVDALFYPQVEAGFPQSGCLSRQFELEALADGQGNISFQLPAEELGFVPQQLEAEYRREGSSDWTVLETEQLAREGEGWSFPAPSGTAPGEPVTVRLLLKSQEHRMLLPETAVKSLGREQFVYAVMERNGLFGTESYLLEIPAEVVERDGIYAAVEAAAVSDQVVFYSSRPLYDGMTVSVVEP